MPNRIVREGIITSEAVNSLGWAEEVFYRRLHSVVDDYGRYFATPTLLRAACYPLQVDKVGNQDVAKWLTACVRAGLVRAYTVGSKDYLEVVKFGQHVRAKASKFPHPPDGCDALALQMHNIRTASAHVVEDGDEDDIGARFAHFWDLYPKKAAKQEASKAFKLLSPSVELFSKMLGALELAKGCESWQREGGKFVPHAATWIRGRRWEDELPQAEKVKVDV